MDARFGPNAWVQGCEAPRLHRLTLAAVAAIALAGLAAIALALRATPASGAFSGQNGLIAFWSDRDGFDFEIYVMGPEGQNPTRLTNAPGEDQTPDISRDGTKIAFTSERDGLANEIYVMDADGQNQTRLTNNSTFIDDEHPAFSPDGSKIAFRSTRDDPNGEIYVMDADGQNPTRLTNNAVNDGNPAWSPDGSKIVFSRASEVFVMDADGQNQTNLTNSPGGDLAGDFSPDGSKIVFISTRDGNFEVYLMDADGQNQTNLTNNAADDERPVFSPDGTKIAFLSTRDGTAQVHVMDPDGQNPTNLTNREGFDVAWDWGVAVPPETTIDSGPSGNTNDPTPTFSFSSSDSEASFECKVDSDDYAACTSPQTVAQLADGSHTFNVRATDSFGIVDPTPASRAFMVRTAEVSVTGSTLQVTAAAGAKDNLRITKPSASTLRVTDVPSGAYTGSGVHVGAGCTRTGDYSANCNAAGITLVRVASADQDDKVVNATPVKSLLNGGAANDTLTGGSANDTLTGSTGADVLRGLGGNDQLLVRDGISDTTINCGGGTADKAVLDPLPEDPDSSVSACETKTRPGPYVALGDSLSNGVGASSPATTGFVARLFADYQASLDVDELVNEAENGETSGALRTGGQLSRGLADINAGSDTKAVTIEVGAIDALFGTCAGHWHQPDDCDFRENFRAILTRLDVALQNDPGAEEFSTMAYYNPPNATIGGSPADRERNLLGTNLKIGCSDAGTQLGLNDVIYQEAGRLGIPVANPYPAFKQHGQAYMSQTDPMRIHPNDAGYGAIAQAFRNASGLCG